MIWKKNLLLFSGSLCLAPHTDSVLNRELLLVELHANKQDFYDLIRVAKDYIFLFEWKLVFPQKTIMAYNRSSLQRLSGLICLPDFDGLSNCKEIIGPFFINSCLHYLIETGLPKCVGVYEKWPNNFRTEMSCPFFSRDRIRIISSQNCENSLVVFMRRNIQDDRYNSPFH